MDQMRLVADILDLLYRHGVKNANLRQMNAVVTAANTICDEMEKPHVLSTPNMGLEQWLQSDDTGLSSLAMTWQLFNEPENRHMVGSVKSSGDKTEHPHDPADFGRCYRFLKAVPEATKRLDRMRTVSAVWDRFIDNWSKMTYLYERDISAGYSDELYELMQDLMKGSRSSIKKMENES